MGKRNGYRSGCVSFGLCSWGKVSGDEIARVRERERDVMIGELFSSESSCLLFISIRAHQYAFWIYLDRSGLFPIFF